MNFSTLISLLFLVGVLGCRPHLYFKRSQAQQYRIKDSLPTIGSSKLQSYLKPLHDSLSKVMNEVIGEAKGDFVKKKPNSSLGNLVVDAMYLNALLIDSALDGAITNFGGLRVAEIKKGPISRGKLFELLPFENELVILEVKGSDLEKWLNLIAENGGWPVQFGHVLSFKNKKLQMNTRDTISKHLRSGDVVKVIGDININPNQSYKIATNDYVANGGENCDFLKACQRKNTGITIRDLTIEAIKKAPVYPNFMSLEDVKFDYLFEPTENRLKFEE